MKMAKATQLIFNTIKTYRRIRANKIAEILNMPLRRIYDVTIILEGLDLINVEKPEKGWAKIYVWKGVETHGQKVTFNAHKIRVETRGVITGISNNGTYAVIKATDKLEVQNYVEYLDNK